MSAITVRNVPEETHRALKARARSHGRSTEAEVRAILEEVAMSQDPVKLGSLLADIGRGAKGVEFNLERDQAVREPVDFR